MRKKIIITIVLLCIGLFLYPVGLNLNSSKAEDIEVLLSKALSSKKISLFSISLHRDVFNEINGMKVNYSLLGIDFLSTQELLKHKKDNFYSVNIKFHQNKAKVYISNFKNGRSYSFEYEKNGDSWKETNSQWGIAKFEPSKPYYIYWEIVRLNNPNYMDFKSFGIPKDSLK